MKVVAKMEGEVEYQRTLKQPSGAEEDPYNGSYPKLAQQGRADSADEGCASSGWSHVAGQPLTGGTVEEDSSDEGCAPDWREFL